MIREAMAPMIATSGVQHYWKGQYEVSMSRLRRARRYAPKLFENSEFQAYLGLAYYRLGSHIEAKGYLQKAHGYLSVTSSINQTLRSHNQELLAEIRAALNEINT